MDRMIDLHTHTTTSDGSMRPRELVKYALEKGLSAVAVTDHDTIEGVEAALDEGSKIGIEVVAGIEISLIFKPEMHMLGFFFGKDYLNIKGTLDLLKKSRDERNPKIIRKLNELGYDISIEEVEKEAGEGTVGRPHIAKVMVNKGYAGSIRDVFDKLLASGKPAYFSKDKLTPEQGIKEIRKAGGIPVLAHPIYLDLNTRQLDKLFSELTGYGLGGIEALYPDNTIQQTGNLLRLAKKYNFLVTGGSDFHGSFKPDLDIGSGYGDLKVPYELLDKMKASVGGKA